jgi:hypothetical protein
MWKSIGKMAITAFLASFLDHLGRRAGEYLWPEDEEKESEKDSEKKKKKEPEKDPEKKT